MEAGRYEGAIQGFESLIAKHKKGMIYESALFNIASAYQKSNQCEKSKEIFSKLLKIVDNKSFLKLQALVQLNYSHECLGETRQALLTLQQVDKKKSKMDDISRMVEIPSRFSLLYFQSGNESQGILFRDRALDGIKKIKSSIKDPAIVDQTAGRLFYIMGQSFVRAESIQMKEYLLALPHHQMYLIQSYLLNNPAWSPQARKQLVELYEKLWLAYKKLPSKKKSLWQSQIAHTLNDFQNIARESHSSSLNKIFSSIQSKAFKRFQLKK